MLTDVDVVLFLNFASEDDVEVFDLFSSLGNDLPIKVKLDVAVIVEVPSFFVFDMQL